MHGVGGRKEGGHELARAGCVHCRRGGSNRSSEAGGGSRRRHLLPRRLHVMADSAATRGRRRRHNGANHNGSITRAVCSFVNMPVGRTTWVVDLSMLWVLRNVCRTATLFCLRPASITGALPFLLQAVGSGSTERRCVVMLAADGRGSITCPLAGRGRRGPHVGESMATRAAAGAWTRCLLRAPNGCRCTSV